MENCRHIKPDHYKSLKNAFIEYEIQQPNKISTCKSCNSSLYLFLCIECSYLGCTKNAHYRTHFASSNHFLSYNIEKDCIYCFQCNQYIKRQTTKKHTINNRDVSASLNYDYTETISELTQTQNHNITENISSHKNDDNTDTLKSSKNTLSAGKEDNNFHAYYPFHQNTLLSKISEKVYKIFPCVMLKGFGNLGNTCYLNSLFSILVYSDEFKDYFLSNKHCITSCWEENCILCGFKEIYADIYSKQPGITFHNFIYRLSKKDPYFLGSKQHDAHELFIHIADLIHKHGQSNECECLMHRIFFGINYVNYTCKSCNLKYQREEEYFNLSLQLRESIQMSITNFYDLEIVSELNCEKCQKNTDFERKYEIKLVPRLLCLHFKRFRCVNNRLTKISDLIINNNVLKLNGTCYILYGFIVHEGEMNNGHYVSFIRIGNRFMCFDDEKIYNVAASVIERNESYIVFYRQI